MDLKIRDRQTKELFKFEISSEAFALIRVELFRKGSNSGGVWLMAHDAIPTFTANVKNAMETYPIKVVEVETPITPVEGLKKLVVEARPFT